MGVMMMKNVKKVVLMCVILLVVLANTASARYLVFWPQSGNVANWNDTGAWLNVDNAWAAESNPTALDTVEIRDPDKKLIIDTPAVCKSFIGPGHQSWSTNSSVDVLDGGALEVQTTGWGVTAHIGYAGDGTLSVYSGGSVHVKANAANWEGGETLVGGPSGSALLNIQGGTYISDNALSIDLYNDGGSSKVQVDSGLLNIGWLNIGLGGSIDLTDGVIEIRNNMWDFINGWVSDGKITAFGGTGTVNWDYGETTAGVTTITAVPEPATMAILGLGGLLLRRRKRA